MIGAQAPRCTPRLADATVVYQYVGGDERSADEDPLSPQQEAHVSHRFAIRSPVSRSRASALAIERAASGSRSDSG